MFLSRIAGPSTRRYTTKLVAANCSYSTQIPPRRDWAVKPRLTPSSSPSAVLAALAKSNPTRRPKKAPAPPPNMFRSPTPHEDMAHRIKMKKLYPDGWNPPKKLSREAMDGLRTLHAHDPVTFSTPVLAEKFKVSPEAVARILKSRWRPSEGRLAKILVKDRKAKEEWLVEQRKKEWEERRKSWVERADTGQFSFR